MQSLILVSGDSLHRSANADPLVVACFINEQTARMALLAAGLWLGKACPDPKQATLGMNRALA